MKTFARIIETETTQFLVYVEYDQEKEEHKLHQIFQADFGTVDVAAVWPDKLCPDGEALAYAALEKSTKELAEKLIRAFNDSMKESA